MSTSLLYHGFGILDHTYKSAEYDGGAITFNVAPKTKSLRCPICRNRKVICRGSVERIFRTIPIGSKPAWLRTPIQRVECPKCQVVRQTKISFADSKKTYTKAFMRFVLDLSRWMSIKAVARLERKYSKPRLKGLQKIAIDEISIGKGHKYLTLVLDQSRQGRICKPGKRSRSFAAFLEAAQEFRCPVYRL